MRRLNAISQFILFLFFQLRFVAFDLRILIVFLECIKFPPIMLLETESILQFGLDLEMNFCFCIYDHLFFQN